MRGAWCVILLTLVASCEACNGVVNTEDRCENVERAGSCTRDDECAVAYCASACCESTEPCGAPMPFARRELGKHDCLYEQGATVEGVCRKSTDCLCDTC